MIEVLPQSHDATVGVRASGLLTDADYKQTLIPLLEKTIAAHGRARLLVEIADTFAGMGDGCGVGRRCLRLHPSRRFRQDRDGRRAAVDRLVRQAVRAVHRRRDEDFSCRSVAAGLGLDRHGVIVVGNAALRSGNGVASIAPSAPRGAAGECPHDGVTAPMRNGQVSAAPSWPEWMTTTLGGRRWHRYCANSGPESGR